MENNFVLALFPGIILGGINAYYWSRQGYPAWHMYYLSIVAFYALSVMILNKLN